MTLLIIAGYRKRKHIETCLRSVDAHLKGVTDLTFIDDSADPEHIAWLAQYGKVSDSGGQRQGYTATMRRLCSVAAGRPAFILEEDFTFMFDIELEQLEDILFHRPYLAQIALLRGPHFDIEHQHGGLIEALKAKGHTFHRVAGVLEHTATFTANPSLWRADVLNTGWPTGRWSEEIKRDQLLKQGYRFAYLPGIRVKHHGEREGFGY